MSISEINDMVENEFAKHDNGDIYQIVGDKNRGKCPFRIVSQHLDMAVSSISLCIHFVQIAWA